MAGSTDNMKVNQVLRLRIEGQTYRGLIVNMGDEAMLVATTSQEAPAVASGSVVQGEIFKPDGLYHFTTRLMGFQMTPVLVLILDTPKAIRRIQRRRESRHPVDLMAQLIFISAERSLNVPGKVSNLSFGGLEVLSSAAPPVGYHLVVLLEKGDRQLSTICTVAHVETHEAGFRIGLAFIEMSRTDLEDLHTFVSTLGE